MTYKDFYSHLLDQKFLQKNLHNGTVDGYVTSNKQNMKNWFETIKIFNYKDYEKYNRVAFLNNLYVDEDSRGQGTGTKLLDWFINEATENGAEAIYVISDENNENLIDLTEWYVKNGFERTGVSSSGETLLLFKNEI